MGTRSIYDPDADAVFSVGWTQVSPTTWVIDPDCEIVHQRPGGYANRDQLEDDIRGFLHSTGRSRWGDSTAR